MHRKGGHVPLTLRYQFKPDMGFGCLHEVMEGKNEAINNFYSQVCFCVLHTYMPTTQATLLSEAPYACTHANLSLIHI